MTTSAVMCVERTMEQSWHSRFDWNCNWIWLKSSGRSGNLMLGTSLHGLSPPVVFSLSYNIYKEKNNHHPVLHPPRDITPRFKPSLDFLNTNLLLYHMDIFPQDNMKKQSVFFCGLRCYIKPLLGCAGDLGTAPLSTFMSHINTIPTLIQILHKKAPGFQVQSILQDLPGSKSDTIHWGFFFHTHV